MSGCKVSSFAGSRSSSHSRLDLLAEVAAGEAQSETSSWRDDEGQSSSLGQSVELPILGLKALKHSTWDENDLPVATVKRRRTQKERVMSEADLGVARSMSYSGLEMQTTGEDSVHGKGDKRKKGDRLSWSGELQDRFVKAVHYLGLKDAVPKDILKLMQVQDLTREQVASHLQKYRQALKKGVAAKIGGPRELKAAQQRYMPGLPAIGVPCDPQTLAFTARYNPVTSTPQQTSAWAAYASALKPVQHGKSAPTDLHAQPLRRASADEAAFSRIRDFAAQNEAAMTAEFAYPADPPVFIPPRNTPDNSAALPLLDIQPLKLPEVDRPSIKSSEAHTELARPLANLLAHTFQQRALCNADGRT